ncbi:TPA: site-specific integrase, partial [Klebsiella pneumoniae]|nr:site-specific integrase [Klebsiella pneumoniae]
LTANFRNKGLSINTIESNAKVLGLLQSFFDEKNMNIMERILGRKFLTSYEIDDLTQYLTKRHKVRKVVNINSNILKDYTKYSRLSTVANYLEWLCEYLIRYDYERREDISRFINSIRERRPRKQIDFDFYTKVQKSLSDSQIVKVFKCLQPESELNPFSKSVQSRNELIITMLYCLGIRAGELLNLRISDIDFEKKIIKIVRRHDDIFDDRLNQPLVKTLNRDLYFSDWLESKIYNYMTGERQKYSKKNKHDFLFICQGSLSKCGFPLTISAYEKMIMKIKRIDPTLNDFSGHRLRHTWNYVFSKESSNLRKEGVSFEPEEIRSYLMGWSPNSGTVKFYNHKFNIEQSNLLMRKVQMKIEYFLGGGKNE